MADKIERDALTGVETTGHEWDGIRELDNPMPRWWLWVFYASIAFAVIWWILYPAWPTPGGATRGLLGSNQRLELDERLAEARAAQAVFLERIAAKTPEEIVQSPDLLSFAVHGGQRHFNDNCAPCHGSAAAASLHYPSLADDSLDLGRHVRRESSSQSITASATRTTWMPLLDHAAFGADGILDRQESRRRHRFRPLLERARARTPSGPQRGAETFAMQCASCHGEFRRRHGDAGCPRPEQRRLALWRCARADRGPDQNPRHGVMPPWQDGCQDEVIKISPSTCTTGRRAVGSEVFEFEGKDAGR
jgi:cytochrome c oxidase cbb3-type subunit 3